MAQHSSLYGTWPTPAIPHRPASHRQTGGRVPAFALIARIELEHEESQATYTARQQADDRHAEQQRLLWSNVQIVAVA